jgi:hypothetical protein
MSCRISRNSFARRERLAGDALRFRDVGGDRSGDDVAEQVVLRADVVVERGAVHARALRNVSELRRVEALLREDLANGRPDHALPLEVRRAVGGRGGRPPQLDPARRTLPIHQRNGRTACLTNEEILFT